MPVLLEPRFPGIVNHFTVTVSPESTDSTNSVVQKVDSNTQIQTHKKTSTKAIMMAIFKNLPVKTMKESKIDAVLKHFSHRDYFSQLLWDVAVYIQQDLGMAIHCQQSAKVEAYKYFLTESFVRSIFKV